MTGSVCACTHYLVFKEPTAGAPVAPHRHRSSGAFPRCSIRVFPRRPPPRSCLEGPAACRRRPRLGEPCKVTRSTQQCQPRDRRIAKRLRLWLGFLSSELERRWLSWQNFRPTERSTSIAYGSMSVKSAAPDDSVSVPFESRTAGRQSLDRA